MIYPTVENENTSRDMIDTFGGYNHNLRIEDNEFYDMQNMTSSLYPVLSSRPKRGVPIIQPNIIFGNIRGMLYKGDFYHVVASDGELVLYKNGTKAYRLAETSVSDDVERKLIMMGAYIIILPDKQYFNTAKTDDFGYIESVYSSISGESVKIVPCDSDGTAYCIDGVSDTMPENFWDGYVWLDTGDSPATLKIYATSNQMWTTVASTCIRITCFGIGKNYKAGDGIDVSGFTNIDTLKLNTNTVIKKVVDDNTIVVSGQLDTVQSKNTMKIHTSKEVTEEANVFVAYCDESIVEDEFKGKQLVVGNKVFDCVSNTTPKLSYERKVSDDENKWLACGSPTLLVEQDALNNTAVCVREQYNGVQGFYPDNLQGSIVRLGEDDYYAEVVAFSTDAGGDAKLIFKTPVTIKAGASIYPVDEYISETLYTTMITTSTLGTVKRGEGVSLTLECAWEQNEPITLSRKMPDIDYIIESNNRLWGCRFGDDGVGNFVNEIYASKLGDFKNWNCFEGISTDSYRASLGSQGKFTGAISYQGYPLFFKENYIHTIYGNYPAQYQINNTACRGVEEGSEDSLAMINEVLYYKSISGVMAYSGALPSEVSYALGDKVYKNAKSCAFKGKYYMSAQDKEYNDVLFVYDTRRNLWHKEDGISALQLCATDDDVYYLDTNYNFKSLFGSGGVNEEKVEWFVETGDIGLSYVDKKYITRMSIRLSMEIGTNVSVYIQYDSSGDWERKINIYGNKLKTMTLPIRPLRCDHFRLRIQGKGNVKIYSISKTLEQGSDV